MRALTVFRRRKNTTTPSPPRFRPLRLGACSGGSSCRSAKAQRRRTREGNRREPGGLVPACAGLRLTSETAPAGEERTGEAPVRQGVVRFMRRIGTRGTESFCPIESPSDLLPSAPRRRNGRIFPQRRGGAEREIRLHLCLSILSPAMPPFPSDGTTLTDVGAPRLNGRRRGKA